MCCFAFINGNILIDLKLNSKFGGFFGSNLEQKISREWECQVLTMVLWLRCLLAV